MNIRGGDNQYNMMQNDQECLGNLHIVESPWAARSKKQPRRKVINIKPKRGKKIILHGIGSRKYYVLSIIDVTPNEIHLTVDGLSLKQGNALKKKGIDLTACGHQDFVIKMNEMVELNTCSMDAGVKWRVKYLG